MTLACATFTAVCAEDTETTPNAEEMQPTDVTTTIAITTGIEDITTTVPTTTETIITTLSEDEKGLHIDTSKMEKFYYSEDAAFKSDGIIVYYDAVDVTNDAEISFIEAPGIYDSKTFQYEINFDVIYQNESQTVTLNVQIGELGDVDMNHKVELYDVISISKKILKKDTKVTDTFTSFMVNTNGSDKVINLYDAIWIAQKLLDNTPKPDPSTFAKAVKVLPKPDVSKYNTSTIAGVKKYANDCILYQASVYGIASEHIFFEDDVDEWHGYSWNAPITYISDMDYYISQEKYQPLFYRTTAKGLGESLMSDVWAAVDEWKYNYEEQQYKYGSDTWRTVIGRSHFTIKWKHLGHNNYEVYVMWGGDEIYDSNGNIIGTKSIY